MGKQMTAKSFIKVIGNFFLIEERNQN